MSMQDDEFGDEIDWSAVQLPSVSAPGSAGNATNGPPTTSGPPPARHSWGGGVPAPPHQNQSAGIPQHDHSVGGYGQNFAAASVGAAGAAPPIHTNFAPSNNDMDALRRQVASLQTQLQSKDDQIFELEATAAASAAESAHRTQRAESEAREKVRLAQEEARRAMAEADRNRGGMIRYKKKAAELEAEKQANEGGRNPSHPGEGNLGAWGPPVADVEMRKVTPVTEDDASPAKGGDIDASPAQSSGSKKRKARQAVNVDAADVPSYLPRQFGGAGNAIAIGGGSTRQRLARHLLEREEMGCYGGMAETEATATMDVDSVGTEKQQLSKALRQDIRIDGETRALVKSVIFQMAEAPCAAGNLSSSGLVQVLLTKFHSLFHCVGDENAVTVDGDGDHVMGGDSGGNGENRNESSTEDSTQCYQRMALALLKDGEGETSCLTYKTVSWRAALRLLSVLNDILLLSGNARDDLRWWFYQSRQSAGGGAIGDGNSPSKAVGSGSQGCDGDALARIEGLPTSLSRGRSNAEREEVLWTPDCRPASGQPDVWDPVTMAGPCNALFDLLVGIMQRNTFDCSSDATKDTALRTAPEEIVVRSVQLKAIDVILALMSDAPPYDQAKDGGDGNRTPYVWKFWFDSLLPSHPHVQIGTPLEVGDILSLWEKSSSGNEGQQEQLVILIKSRILQLLSHFLQSSSSVHQSLRQNANEKEKKSITKRIVSAILSDLEDCVVPVLSSDDSTKDAAQHLELCHSCLQFLLILSRSNEGIRVLRLQMRLESEDGKQSRWSQSAIGMMALVLGGTLSFATKRETAALQYADLADPLDAIVKQCISFFKNLLLFVDQQRKSSSKPVIFSSLASEHSTVFQSSLEGVLAHQSPSRATDSPRLLRCGEGLKRDVQELLAEIAEDRKEG